MHPLDELPPEAFQEPENFRAARRELDLSLNGMAGALKLESGNNIRKYESGERQISGPISVSVWYFLHYGPPQWFSDADSHEAADDAA